MSGIAEAKIIEVKNEHIYNEATRSMQKLMIKVQDEARAIKQFMHGDLPKLEKQLAETTGLFKSKDRKALQEKIAGAQQEIDRRMDRLPGILKEDAKTEKTSQEGSCGAYIKTTLQVSNLQGV